MMLAILLIGFTLGLILGMCITLYLIDKEFVFADEDEEPMDIFTYVAKGKKK